MKKLSLIFVFLFASFVLNSNANIINADQLTAEDRETLKVLYNLRSLFMLEDFSGKGSFLGRKIAKKMEQAEERFEEKGINWSVILCAMNLALGEFRKELMKVKLEDENGNEILNPGFSFQGAALAPPSFVRLHA